MPIICVLTPYDNNNQNLCQYVSGNRNGEKLVKVISLETEPILKKKKKKH